jgi:hypothetical protein
MDILSALSLKFWQLIARRFNGREYDPVAATYDRRFVD